MFFKNIIKFIRPGTAVRQLYKWAKATKRYYSPLSYKYYLFLISFIRCFIKGGFTVDEVFQLGLGSLFTPAKKIDKYVGSYKMMQIDEKLNPRSWFPVSMNKGIFYLMCKNLNLPIPEMYALIYKKNASISFLSSSFLEQDDLIKFIRYQLPNEFVIKPELGTIGSSIYIYSKTNSGIVDAHGDRRSEKEIVDHILNNKNFDSFVVQERLTNHHDLYKLFPSDFLHTLRIITLLDLSGRCQILHAHLNVAMGQNVASQLSNIKVSIALTDGMLQYAVVLDKKIGGFERVTELPETGQNIKEIKLPFWEEILSLAKEAALKFLPLRTLGWDIAITEKGLRILETNNWPYTPPNFFQPMDKFMETLVSN